MAFIGDKIERGIAGSFGDDVRKSVERYATVGLSDLRGAEPLSWLEDMLKSWPLHDLRLEEKMRLEYDGIQSTDEQTMRRISGSMHVSVIRRDRAAGRLDFEVRAQCNISEVDHYNQLVSAHNTDWAAQGSPVKIFDARHGEEYAVEETYVADTDLEDHHHHRIELKTSGPLSAQRPAPKYTVLAKVSYFLSLGKKKMTLEYVARDIHGKVLYYNKISGEDLAHLVRRSIHELWGNPFVAGLQGAYLEGISYLIQGKKLPICYKDNVRPSILGDAEQYKDHSPERIKVAVEEGVVRSGSATLRHIVPVICFVSVIVWSTYCLCQMDGDRWEEGTGTMFFWGMMIILAATILLPKIGYSLLDKAEVLRLRKKFL